MPADLPKTARVTESARFKAILDLKCSAADDLLSVFAAKRPVESSSTRPRVGLVVGRRHGPAVARNRKKRLLRSAFRAIQAELPPGFDFVLIPRATPAARLDAYVRSLAALAPKAAARASRRVG